MAPWQEPARKHPVAHPETKTKSKLETQTSVHILTTATVSPFLYICVSLNLTSYMQVVRDDGFELVDCVPKVKQGEKEDVERRAHLRAEPTTVRLPDGLDAVAFDNVSAQSRISVDTK
jgi:hypothetical protein